MAIYFIHYTVNLKKRFAEIKTHYGASWSSDLEVLAVLECDSAENASLEKEMHNTDYTDGRFNATRKEWFRFTGELRRFIEEVGEVFALAK